MKFKILILLVTTAIFSQSKPYSGVKYFQETKGERTQWFKEAKFGMFIHWGLYSPAGGYWDGKKYPQHYAEWIQNWAKVPTPEYARQMKPKFTAKKYNAKQWAKLAKETGMEYAVLTTKHHEGFTLFNSKASYSLDNPVSGGTNISPKGRDLVGEYVDAFRKEGLHPGVYYSLIDWQHPKAPPYNNLNGKLKNTDYSEYVDYMHTHINELMTNYGKIDLLWVDYSTGRFQDKTWKTKELLENLVQKQPEIVVSNRFWKGIENRYGDFITPEKFVPATGYNGALWEVCHTMNESFGYSAHDENWKSAKEIVRLLIDTNSKGGNLLLNIGPDGEGKVPTRAVKILKQVGKWVHKHQSAIYGTDANVFESLNFVGKSNTKYISDKKTRIHLFVYEAPKNGKIELNGLKNRIVKISELNGETLPFSQFGTSILMDLPKGRIPEMGWVIAVDIDGKPAIEQLNYTVQSFDRKVTIHAKKMKVEGPKIRLENNNIGYWLDLKNEVSAQFLIKQVGAKEHHGGHISEGEGKYKVVLEYAVANHHGGVAEVKIGEQKLVQDIKPTGGWNRYKKLEVGTITIKEKGLQQVNIKALKLNTALMNLRSIRLIPVK